MYIYGFEPVTELELKVKGNVKRGLFILKTVFYCKMEEQGKQFWFLFFLF